MFDQLLAMVTWRICLAETEPDGQPLSLLPPSLRRTRRASARERVG
jgi:hypothetical protein